MPNPSSPSGAARFIWTWCIRAVVALAVLGAFFGTSHSAKPASAAPVVGARLFVGPGECRVQIDFVFSDASFDDALFLLSPAPGPTGTLIFNHGPPLSAAFTVTGPAELVFGIHVDETGDGVDDTFDKTYYMGDGITPANPDGIPHAQVDNLGGGVFLVGFEDILGGGDLDYDDIQYRFTAPCISTNRPPRASCIEYVNPHGQTIPPAGSTTLPGPKGGQNEDGFYLLGATDPDGGVLQIFLKDSASSAVFGPFAPGTKIKLTQAPGATPNIKPGAGVIDWKIQIKGDAIVYAVDAGGLKSPEVSCLVPPPPK